MIFFLLFLFMVKFPCHISIESVLHMLHLFIKICIPKFVNDSLKPPDKRGIHIIFFLISA